MKLAWRNLFRNKRRTALTVSAVSFACAVLSFFISLQQSSYKTAIEATTSLFQGDFQIQHKEYNEDPKIYRTIPDITGSLKGINAAAPRVYSFALLASETRTLGIQIVGVSPSLEPLVSTIPKNVRTGEFLVEDDKYSIIIGTTLAEKLKVNVGDELTMLGQGADGSMAAGVFNIKGIYSSGSKQLDGSIAEIPIKTAREVFSLGDNLHAVVVKSDSPPRVEADVRVLGWEELNPGLKESIELDLVSSAIFYGSLILIISLGVLNTFLMSLLERTREFGLLMSLGMTPLRLVSMVIKELVFTIFIGILPGFLIAAGSIYYFSVYGFSVPGSKEINSLWNLPAALYPQLEPSHLVVGPVVIFVVTSLVVMPFSLRLLRITPVEALRST